MVYEFGREEAYADLAAEEGDEVAEWVRLEYQEEFEELLGVQNCSTSESASPGQALFSTLYPDDVTYGEEGIEDMQRLYERTVKNWKRDKEIDENRLRLMQKVEETVQEYRDEDWSTGDLLEFRSSMLHEDGMDGEVREAVLDVLEERKEERRTARHALASFLETYETLRAFREEYRELEDSTMNDVRSAVEAVEDREISFSSLLSDDVEDSDLPDPVKEQLRDEGYSRSDVSEIANALTV